MYELYNMNYDTNNNEGFLISGRPFPEKSIVHELDHSHLRYYAKGIYTYVFNSSSILPRQGWKIHISPTIKMYTATLLWIIKWAYEKKVDFKFITNYRVFEAATDKRMNVSQFGKIITIYPMNETEFIKCVKELNSHFSTECGLNVPSDQGYSGSNIVYYRYGGINTKVFLDNENDHISLIQLPNGQRIIDQRKPYYFLPAGLEDPFTRCASEYSETKKNVLITGKKGNYVLDNIVRRLSTGDIFSGYRTKDSFPVLIKQTKLGAYSDLKHPLGKGKLLRINESHLFQKFATSGVFPKFIEQINFLQFNLFVFEKINGESIQNFAKRNPLFGPNPSSSQVSKFCKKLTWSYFRAKRILCFLHKNGYAVGDVSTDNFVISERDHSVYLVDAETAYTLQGKKSYLHNPIFEIGMSEGLTDFEKDFYRLAMSFIYAITGKNRELLINHESIEFELSYFNNLSRAKFDTLILDIKKNLHWPQSHISLYEKKFDDLNQAQKVEFSYKLMYEKYQHLLKKKLVPPKSMRGSDFRVNNISLFYGWPGSLLGLSKIGFNIPAHNATVLNRKAANLISRDKISSGLSFGLAGIALVVSSLSNNRMEQNIAFIELKKRLKNGKYRLPYDFANGYAGIGYALLKLNDLHPDKKLIIYILNIADMMITNQQQLLNEVNCCGFEYGLSGIAYFYIELYQSTKIDKYLQFSEKLLDREKNNVVYQDSCYGMRLHQNSGPLYPYFMVGIAGYVYSL
ncbi:lanthionine synthetase LanC family protein [Oenococcus sp.]|uniref:class III lanthionine synthetase LanKC N-terminal domain-containing protein n=1 Tax=Oenococcus sp. TaxID=1979414 RepID=UPI0039ED212E